MGKLTRSRRLSLGLTVALIAGATLTGVAGPSAPTASAAPGPCGPLGTLVEFQLNDRCDYGTGVNPMNVGNRAVVRALGKAGLFATLQTCRNGTVVPVVATPDRLLVAAGSAERLRVALATVRRRLDNVVVGEPRPINALTAILRLRPGTLTPRFMRNVVPTLQGRGWSADLNYLEPVQPQMSFRPDNNPLEARGEPLGKGGKESVLVVDSPAQNNLYPQAPDVVLGTFGSTVVYDLDGNRKVDEDHGHGVFVASLVKRLSPQARVVLAGVRGRQVPGLARWSPMMFTDADLIRSMGEAFGLSPGGTAVRRAFHVVNLSLGGAGCDGIAARLPLGRFLRDLAGLAVKNHKIVPTYVAASGNDGADVKHFPAAWRDRPTIERAADAVDLALSGGAPTGAGNQIRQIQAFLQRRTIAVGSWTNGVRDAFSNCGKWVNGIADGAAAVSRYPTPPTRTSFASWSGTSFATPRVSAVVAGGAGIPDVTVAESIGVC